MEGGKSNLTLSWLPGSAVDGEKSKEEQSKMLDEEVEIYSQWLADLPDEKAKGALSNPERALIKTYLVQKLAGKLGGH